MRTLRLLVLTALSTALLAACQKNHGDSEGIVKIGSRTIDANLFGAFSAVVRTYPHALPPLFPAERPNITFMVETEVLFRTIPSSFARSVERSGDWQWKKRYFPGQAYALDVLMNNMGAMESDIESYYRKNRSTFADTIRIPVASADTAADPATDSPREMRDSIRIRELGEVRAQIIERLFLTRYPADSAFIADAFRDSLPDTSVINSRWFSHMQRQLRQRNQDFFLTRTIKELYGETPPDTLEAWAIEKGLVGEQDLAIVLGWLQPERRALYETPERRNELYRWLIRWKVFSEKAHKTGYTTLEQNKPFLDWAFKIEVVTRYIEQELAPDLRHRVSVDTSLCVYSYWDNIGRVEIPPDSAGVAAEVEKSVTRMSAALLDSMLHRLRSRAGVTFLQSDFRDERNEDPAVLMAQADSLRDSGFASQSEGVYRTLARDFSFLPQGQQALAELAKLQTEKQLYRDAIRTYRHHLELAAEAANRCNVFFMVGFMYDEYLANPQLAEVNYKWVLKNTPECELRDDAEFMMTHLDEPMVRIEDLRAEALRQGRTIDYSDDPLEGQLP